MSPVRSPRAFLSARAAAVRARIRSRSYSECIDDNTHQHCLGCIALAGSVSGANRRAVSLLQPLSHRGEHRVAREPIPVVSGQRSGVAGGCIDRVFPSCSPAKRKRS